MCLPKKITLFALLLFPAFVAGQPFKHKELQEYPEGLGFIPVQDVLATIEPMPAKTKEQYDEKGVTRTVELIGLPERDIFNNNMYISGNDARKKNRISSMGYDPYQRNFPAYPGADYQGPVIHHCTIAIAQHLLKKSGSKKVVALPSWLYHLQDRPDELSDENYLLVHAKIPAAFKAFKNLTSEEKKDFIRDNLADFYTAIRYIHYAFPDENNLFVNPDDNTFMLPIPLSPDNEGLGKYAKYGKAILGQDCNKAKHNIRNWYDGGHRIFEDIVSKYGEYDDIKKWQECYEADPIFAPEGNNN